MPRNSRNETKSMSRVVRIFFVNMKVEAVIARFISSKPSNETIQILKS